MSETTLRDRLAKFGGYFQPFDWHHAACSVPGIAACLVYGVVTRDTVTAAVAAGSAFSVGFGLRRARQTRSLIGAVVLMMLATLLGSMTGGNPLIFLPLAAVAAAACSCLALVDDDIWWVVLQATIALIVSGHYGGGFPEAMHRAGIVALAGGIQALCVLGLDRVIPKSQPRPVVNTPIPATRRALLTYGAVAALSVTAAALAAYGLHLDKAYWAPMTALIVLKPKFHLTRQRGVERLAGNIVGCAAATAIAVCLPPTAWFDSLLCILSAGAAYALLKARYAAFSLAVSFTAVMLLFTAHGSAIQGAEQRLYATVLGGAISIAVMWLASMTVARDYRI